MEDIVFFIETIKSLQMQDFINLRKLYLPLVGIDSIMIYEYFNDICLENQNKLHNLNSILSRLQINILVFNNAIEKLEAVGLLKTFRKNDQTSYIYNLVKPHDIEMMDKNPLLKSHLIKNIGKSEYDKILFEQKHEKINKNNYQNVSKKYQDVFSNIFEENLSIDDSYTTMDLVVESYKTHDENILKLTSSHFVKYLMKRNPSYYENQLINSMLKMGFKDSSINLLIDFSFKYNDCINCPYINKIAQDFRSRSIITYDEVRNEISIIEEYKNQKKLKKHKHNISFFSTNNKEENNNDSITSTKEITIEEIFSDEDVKGIF